MTPLKIGIAGAGFAARFHLENYPESSVVVVGVTSARRESRESFAAKHRVQAFSSVEEMLPEIDVLDICTPPSSHQAYMLAAVRAGNT
jgi:predicted dehydrogenase